MAASPMGLCNVDWYRQTTRSLEKAKVSTDIVTELLIDLKTIT